VEGGLTIQTLLLKTTNGHRETPHPPLKRREHLSLADACPTPTKHFLKKKIKKDQNTSDPK
jgi:hypothetical protein